MRVLKVSLVAALVACSAAASLLLRHKATAESRTREALFHQQERQLEELAAENQRLSNCVVRAARPLLEDHQVELAQLRAQTEALRQQTNQLGQKLKPVASQPGSPDASTLENRSQEYPDGPQAAAGAREYDTHQLATAILLYAVRHHGQVPSDFDPLLPDLDKVTKDQGRPAISGTNQFDIVYHGSLSDLSGIPASEVAVLRHRETWAAPDGKRARVYGMLDGHSRIVTSDDNFQSWEVEHVIDSSAAR